MSKLTPDDHFHRALNGAITVLQINPKVLIETEPTAPEGLNAEAINKAAELASLEPVFEMRDEHEDGVVAARLLIVHHPQERRHPPIRWRFWSRYGTLDYPDHESVKPIIEYLRSWQAEIAPIPASAPNGDLPHVTPCWLRAIQSLEHAEMSGQTTTRKEAYAWLKKNGYDDYQLPKFQTWDNYISKAQRARDGKKNAPRYGRTGRPIINRKDS